MTAGAPELFELRLLEVPLFLRERSRQHGSDLLREMELISIGHAAGTIRHELPGRLLELAQELERVYAPYVAGNTDELDAALDRGEVTHPEIVYHLPVSSVAFVQHVAVLLSEVDAYCQAGNELLTLAPSDDIVAYRDWVISEMERQHMGLAPIPWPTFAAGRQM